MMEFENLLGEMLGRKRLELLKFLCENADENGFIMIKISELEEKLNQSKPTILSTFKFLEEKKLFKRLKNGFYWIKIRKENDT